jgi:hypothetical protein
MIAKFGRQLKVAVPLTGSLTSLIALSFARHIIQSRAADIVLNFQYMRQSFTIKLHLNSQLIRKTSRYVKKKKDYTSVQRKQTAAMRCTHLIEKEISLAPTENPERIIQLISEHCNGSGKVCFSVKGYFNLLTIKVKVKLSLRFF